MSDLTQLEQMLQDPGALMAAIGAHPELSDPMGSYIIVQLIKPPTTSAGGVALAQAAVDKQKPVLARVLRVGPGQRGMLDGGYQAPNVAVDDLVLVVKNTAYEVHLEGKTIWVVFEGDILCRVDQQALFPHFTAEQARRAEIQAQIEAKAAAQAEAEKARGVVVEVDTMGEIRRRESGILIANLK